MLENGRTVFDCQIVKLLSENDTYQSYLVDCSDSATAKLLLLLPDPLFNQKQRQAFFDQVGWLSGQTFPCIGSPLKAGDIDGQTACLYPYPPGVSLLQTVNRGFSIRQTIDLIKKIAVCLSAPHSAGLLHGNLSPETIYLDENSPFLADFSLSQLISLNYSSGINPQYTSPEQVRGETPEISVDLYNLGCIFYYLLTGKPPYSGDDAFSIAKQHLQGDFPVLPDELSLLQPLLNSLVEIVVEKRIAIDELIENIVQLSARQEIDQLSVPVADPQLDSSLSDEDVSLFDEAMNSSEMAARIEARLKGHAGDFQEAAPVEIPMEEENDVTAELSQVAQKEKNGVWRFVLVLVLGVTIGSGFYFLSYKKSPAVAPLFVEKKVQTDNILSADLDQGIHLWQEADFNGAESKFKRIIVEYQEDPRAYNNLAAFYAAQGNYEQARDYLEQALATDENYATVYRNLGSVYAEMARGSYGRALQLGQSQALVSLPVFSSQGVINLNPLPGTVVAVQEPSSEKVLPAAPSSKAEQQIVATETVSPNSLSDTPPIVVEQATVEETAEVIVQVEKAEAPMVAEEQEQPGESELADTVKVVLQQEHEENFLQRWAQAWSDQNVDEYLTFYDEKFIPPAGKSRVTWEAQRCTRIVAPKEIIVSLDGFKLNPLDGNRVQIEVIQSYKSDILTDKTRKIFDLQATENSWKITRERSLGVIR